MEYIKPWEMVVARSNMRDQIDTNELRDEIFNLSLLTDNEDEKQEFICEELIPTIFKLRDTIVIPLVKQYMKDIFDYDLVDFDVDTNAKWIKEGEGLYPHYHPGSVMSAIIYPTGSANGLNLFDPRGNACRGYPRKMRTKAFGVKNISPEAGDIYIFPSYIQHSVSHVTEETRLSLLHEFYVRNDL